MRCGSSPDKPAEKRDQGVDILGYHRFDVLRYGGHTQPVTATTEVNSELYENSATTKLEETLKKFKTAALAATYFESNPMPAAADATARWSRIVQPEWRHSYEESLSLAHSLQNDRIAHASLHFAALHFPVTRDFLVIQR